MTRFFRATLGFIFTALLVFSFSRHAMAAAGKLDISVSPSSLSGAGTVNAEVTASNTSSTMLMEDVILIGPGINQSLGNIQPGTSRSETYAFSITEEQLGTSIPFSLRWKEDGVGQTADKSFTISRKASNPKLAFTRSADKTIAATGAVVRFTYTLQNQGDVDLTGVSVTDPLFSSPVVSGVTLPVGSEAQKFTKDFTMADKDITSSPEASYTALGKKSTQTVDSLTVGLGVVKVEVKAGIKATGTGGTNITVDIANTGNVDIRNAKLTDDASAMVKNSFTLKAGESTSVEQTVIAQTKRDVVYTLNATDAMGNALKVASKAVTVVPYIDSGSVALSMEAKFDTSAPKINGKTAVEITLHNSSSSVVLQDVTISETTLGDLETLPYLEGDKTITLQVDSVASGAWRFAVAASDLAGNQYSAQAQPLTPLPLQTETAAPTPTASGEVLETPTPVEAAADKTSDTLMTIMIIIIVLIILAVGALLLLRMQEKKQNRTRGDELEDLEAILEKPVRPVRQNKITAEEMLLEPPQRVSRNVQPKQEARPVREMPKPQKEPRRAPREAPAKRERIMETKRAPRDMDLFEEEDNMPAAGHPTSTQPPAWQPPVRPDPAAPARSFGPDLYSPYPRRQERSVEEDFDDDISETMDVYAPYVPRQSGPQREDTLYHAQRAPEAPASSVTYTAEEQEYERGRFDGMNNEPYSALGDSPAYDRGYLQGCKERSMR